MAQQTMESVLCTHKCAVCSKSTLAGQNSKITFWPRYCNGHIPEMAQLTRKSVMCTIRTMCTLVGQNSFKHSGLDIGIYPYQKCLKNHENVT